jgi:hypothetical protein
MGDLFPLSASSPDALQETAGYAPTPRNAVYYEHSSALGWTVANRPTLVAGHDMPGDDGAVQFNYDQLHGYLYPDPRPGAAFGADATVPDPAGSKSLAMFGTAEKYAQSFSCFFKAKKTAGTDPTYSPMYESLLFGTWSMEFTGSLNTGWGLILNQFDLKLHWEALNIFTSPYLAMDLVFQCEEDRWYHAAGTWDGATYRFYVDGVEVGSQASALAPSGSGSGEIGTLYIGNSRFDFGVYERDGFFFGSLDEVAIYSRPLSALEIQHISDVGHAGSAIPPDPNEMACIELDLEPALCR